MPGLYIHIPFCSKKCDYCDFYSLAGCPEKIDPYIKSLLLEAKKYRGLSFETLYLGGGTPSLLGERAMKSLMQGLKRVFDLSGIEEATIEVNPESATTELLARAFEHGFNRISIGVQSLSNAELRSVGRIHNSREAIKAIEAARRTGFTNMSADLIIGLPGQTWQSLKSSIERLLACKIHHLSVYCLSLESYTALAENPPHNLPEDDDQVGLFYKTRALLIENGFHHYEISNFALPGYECRHNLNYWREGEYLGLGPAAASHLETIRFKNKPDLSSYLKRPEGQTIEVEHFDIMEKIGEEIILRLRLLEEGVNSGDLIKKYGERLTYEFRKKLDEMVMDGELICEGNTFRLNPEHIMTSNRIFVKIIEIN